MLHIGEIREVDSLFPEEACMLELKPLKYEWTHDH